MSGKKYNKNKGLVCKVDGCARAAEGRGMCNMHYGRDFRNGDPSVTRRQVSGSCTGKPCSVEGCERQMFGGIYCSMHYKRFVRFGDPNVRKKRGNGEVGSQPCCVEECQKHANGTFVDGKVYCSTHLTRVKKYGDPHVLKKPARTTPEEKKQWARENQRKKRRTVVGKLRQRFNNGKYRVLHGGGTRIFPKEAFLAIWAGTLCTLCGEPVADEDKSMDHIIPVARGGTNEPENFQLAHLRCNQLKGDKLPA